MKGLYPNGKEFQLAAADQFREAMAYGLNFILAQFIRIRTVRKRMATRGSDRKSVKRNETRLVHNRETRRVKHAFRLVLTEAVIFPNEKPVNYAGSMHEKILDQLPFSICGMMAGI